MGKFIDITGQKFGRLTAIERSYAKNKLGAKGAFWKCRCDCGNEVDVSSYNLRNDITKSCGCLQLDVRRAKFVDLSGKRFGRLTVLGRGSEYIDVSGTSKYKYRCVCDCGNYVWVRPDDLKKGATKSCGCLRKENGTKQLRKIHKERMRGAPHKNARLYNIWTGMKQRCENPNHPRYSDWGGRGISVTAEWHDFASFQNWALQNGYDNSLSIDRIDVNGNYEPANCRWATKKEQANNTRNSRFLEVNGTKHTVAEWSDITGINQATIAGRLRRGWSQRRAVYEPVYKS